MLNFEKLVVWQKAMDYAKTMVVIADSLPTKYQFSFSDQLRRAGLSIPSNIAEGAGRKGSRDRSNFYSISKGSVYESVNILKLLEKLNLINEEKFRLGEIYLQAEEICKMLYGLSR
jgi:four helix bundle protein